MREYLDRVFTQAVGFTILWSLLKWSFGGEELGPTLLLSLPVGLMYGVLFAAIYPFVARVVKE